MTPFGKVLYAVSRVNPTKLIMKVGEFAAAAVVVSLIVLVRYDYQTLTTPRPPSAKVESIIPGEMLHGGEIEDLDIHPAPPGDPT